MKEKILEEKSTCEEKKERKKRRQNGLKDEMKEDIFY